MKSNRRRIRTRTIRLVIPVSFALFILTLSLLTFTTLKRIDLEANAEGLPFAIEGLERAIGFGGLMHNFKDSILRGATEPRYLRAAREDAADAMAELERIDRLQRRLGLGISLSAQREVLETFPQRLSMIAGMHAQRRPIPEIDAAVRYDNTAALEQIDALRAAIADRIQGRLVWINAAVVLLTIAVVAGASVLVATPIVLWRRTHQLGTEALTELATGDLIKSLQRIQRLSNAIVDDLEDRPLNEEKLRITVRAIAAAVTSLRAGVGAMLEDIGACRDSGGEGEDLGRLLARLRDACVPAPADLRIVRPMPTVDAPMPELEIAVRHLLKTAVDRHPDRAPSLEVAYLQTGMTHRLAITEQGTEGAPTPTGGELEGPAMDLLGDMAGLWGGSVELEAGGTGTEITLIWPR